MKNYELWIIMLQWKREFSVKEFISTFMSPSPNKILFDMVKKGFLEKTGWGKYKVIFPEELLKKRADVESAYELLKKVGLKYSLTKEDAVLLWTNGGYHVGRFFGFYPINLKILKSDLSIWKKWLKSKSISYYVNGEPIRETYFGVFYVLITCNSIKSEIVEGLSVDSLDETVKFCLDNIYQYEPALEMLNEMYNLKLNVRYR